MEELGQFIKFRTGWNLSTGELVKLHAKYFDETRQSIDYNRLMEDLRQGIFVKDHSNFLDGDAISKQARHMSFNEIIDQLHRQIAIRIQTMKGENHLKKAYLLLGESRSSVTTRQQLKAACQSRLSVFLNDSEIDEIFNKLDKNHEGFINIRELISLVLKRELQEPNVSIVMNKNDRTRKVRKSTYEDNQNASITYDKQFRGLNPPNPAHCRDYTIAEVESFIADRIFERSNLNDNMVKTTTKLFGDGENTTGEHVITLDMMRYTLWKRLKMNITDEDLQKFFAKYAKGPENVISMFDFIEGLVKKRNISQPLLDGRSSIDRSDRHQLTASLQGNQNIEFFLLLLRKKFNDHINRESRAPHYLLHGSTRMTEKQAKDFLRNRLDVDLDNNSVVPSHVRDAVLVEYSVHGLVDIKRMLLEAMAIKEGRVRNNEDMVGSLPSQTLIQGATVSVDCMPTCLQKSTLSPEKIEELIFLKCTERLKNDHPHASLHKMFRESDGDPRTITRKGMRAVFHRFDILMAPAEFDAFYAKHDRGDGKIDVHSFLKVIMPAVNPDVNPFVPKDPTRVKMETTLSHVLAEMTGRRHDVSRLNGPTMTRSEQGFLQELQLEHPPSVSSTAPSAPAMVPSRPATATELNTRLNSGTHSRPQSARSRNHHPASETQSHVQQPHPPQHHYHHKSTSSIAQSTSNSSWNPLSSVATAVPDNHAYDPLLDDTASVITSTTSRSQYSPQKPAQRPKSASAASRPVSSAPSQHQQDFASTLLQALQHFQLHQTHDASQQRPQSAASAKPTTSTFVPSAPLSPPPSSHQSQRPASASSAFGGGRRIVSATSKSSVNHPSNQDDEDEVRTVATSVTTEKYRDRASQRPHTASAAISASSRAPYNDHTVPHSANGISHAHHEIDTSESSYHLQQSEKLLALAEAYARATGVLPAAGSSTTSTATPTKSSVTYGMNGHRIQNQHPVADDRTVKSSKSAVPSRPSSASSRRSSVEQAQMSQKQKLLAALMANRPKQVKPHKIQEPQPPQYNPATLSFKHLKVHVPHVDTYAPPSHPGAGTQSPWEETMASEFTVASHSQQQPPHVRRQHDDAPATARTTSSTSTTVHGAPFSSRTSTSNQSKASSKKTSQRPQVFLHNSKKFVFGGRKQPPAAVNPLNESLMADYRLRRRALTTSHQEYGVFVRQLQKAMKSRQRLYARQKQLEDEEHAYQEALRQQQQQGPSPRCQYYQHTSFGASMSPRPHTAAM